jgi:type I restriction enzyme S subunit
MTEWKEYRFAELLVDESISYGIVQPGAHTESNSVPIIRVNNIKNGKIYCDDVLKVASSIEEKYKRTRLSGGELLITVVGSVGECAIVPLKLAGWNVARAVSVARIADDFDKRFVKYAFKTDDVIFQMYGNTNDTVQPTLNLSSLKELKFLLPPLPEQRAIASVLYSLDDKIDLLNRQNKTLEAMAETLFRQWFVEEAEDCWEETPLSKIARHVKDGVQPNKKPSVLYCHYSLPAFDENHHPKMDLGAEIQSNKYIVFPNTILISKLNPRFPRVWAIPSSIKENSVCSTEFQVVSPTQNKWYGFICCFLMSKAVVEELTGAAGGTSGSHQRVTPDDIFNLSFRCPDDKTLGRFNSVTNNYWDKIELNRKQIRILEKLRDTLLPKLMSGEIRVTV